jgi:ABC-2 type transport system permease protein
MRTFALLFCSFMKSTFASPWSYLVHFGVPLASFSAMYALLSMGAGHEIASVQAIGLAAYFTMIQGAIVASLTLRDRECGVERRIAIAPISPFAYVAGNGAATLVVLIAQTLVLAAFLRFAFPFDIGIPFPLLLATLCSFALTAAGFGFFMTALGSSSSGAVMIANVVTMFASVLGGALFPSELMSAPLRAVSIAFPQHWLMNALRRARSGDAPWEFGVSLGILALFAALFFACHAAIRRRRRGESA